MNIDRMQVLKLWQQCHITPAREQEIKVLADKLNGYRVLFYEPVERVTGIPWWVVGALDCRESSFNHRAYLGNGDPLDRPTRHVPAGRGPFASWHEGAIDALKHDGMDKLPAGGHWDIVTALIKCEGYNGYGYRQRGLPSPYVWGATNNQRPGKFTADGHFDHGHMDMQPGCAALWLSLKHYHGVDLNEA